MDKKEEYNKLIQDVKASYKESPSDCNSKGVNLIWCDDCEEINLWTYWQGRGNLTPMILLVGQDWGCPYDSANEVVVKNIKEINAGNASNYCIGNISDTDRNLGVLFESIGYHDIINNKYSDLFFTNLSLGYRCKGTSGNLKDTWLKRDYKHFERLISILEPKIVICLGKATLEGVIDALKVENKPKIKGYNDFIQSNLNPVITECHGQQVKIYGFAHCGTMGTLNRNKKKDRSLDNQIEDWKRITGKKYIEKQRA